jgi:hypothetical protein
LILEYEFVEHPNFMKSCETKSCKHYSPTRTNGKECRARTWKKRSKIQRQILGFQNIISVAVVLDLVSVRPRRDDFGVVENLRGTRGLEHLAKMGFTWLQLLKWGFYGGNATIKSPGSTKLTTSWYIGIYMVNRTRTRIAQSWGEGGGEVH